MRRGKCGCVHSPTSVGTAVSQGRVSSAWTPRDKGEELCSTQFRCEGWLVWTAAAEAGKSGVEVWFDEGLGIDGRDVTIAIVNPRCLAISVPFLGRRTLVVSAHGPVADADEEQIRLWSDTLAAELATVAQDENVAH